MSSKHTLNNTAFRLFQDEKSQLLITYIWLDYVSTAIIILIVSDGGMIVGFFSVNVVIIMAYLLRALTPAFIALVVDERVSHLGSSPVWDRQDFSSQRQILGARYCNQ